MKTISIRPALRPGLKIEIFWMAKSSFVNDYFLWKDKGNFPLNNLLDTSSFTLVKNSGAIAKFSPKICIFLGVFCKRNFKISCWKFVHTQLTTITDLLGYNKFGSNFPLMLNC